MNDHEKQDDHKDMTKGGSYAIDKDGRRVLVEPSTAPPIGKTAAKRIAAEAAAKAAEGEAGTPSPKNHKPRSGETKE